MTAQEAYILAKAYTKKSIEGAGSLKGAACQIKSIEAITGGHRITFEWEDNDGEVSTDTMDVMDGADGNDGVGISSITYKETDAHGNYVYTVTLTDTNTYDIICPKGAQGETGATGATGNGIASIVKTSTAGLVDTYTITYTNGQTTTFTVTNGESITVDSAMSGSSTNPVQNKVITEALADKQDAEDNNLPTEAKTIVGAINEHEGDISSLKSGFTNLDNEVNGDATYPYADVITIEDAVPANVAECNVKIEPVQSGSGDPSPDNVRPITGHTEASVQRDGKNLCPVTKVNTLNSDTFKLNAGTYTISFKLAGSGMYSTSSVILRDDSNADVLSVGVGYASSGTVKNGQFTLQSEKTLRLYANNITASTGGYYIEDIQIELGSTATPYEPYQGKTYTIALGDTIYGGTVDFDSGVMTVDRALVDLGDLDWAYNSDGFFYAADPSDMKQPVTASDKPNWMLTCYDAISYNSFVNVYANGTAAEGNGYTRIANTAYTDATDFKTAMTGQKLVYELATPTTIQLTPKQIQLLKGTNTLTASTGQISVTVNGVSGAIGQVQEQVNELAEDVEDVQSGLDTVQSGLTTLGTRVNGIYTRTFYNDTTSTTLNNVYLPKTDKHTIAIIAGNDICTMVVSSSSIVEQNNIRNQITVALNENNQFVVSGCPYYSRPMFIATYDFRQQPT